MKVAYLIMTHKDPILLKRLVNRLTEDMDNYCFIHIDKKVDINKFKDIKENKQIQYIKDRVSVSWSAWTYTIALMNSIKQALEYDEFDRFVFLQGLDYPIKTNKEIRKFFEKNKDIEFVSAMKIDKKSNVNEKIKFSVRWFMDEKNIFEKLMNDICKVFKVLKLNIKVKSLSIKCKDKKYCIYRGWAHMCLTNKAIKYIFNSYENNKKLVKYFKGVYCPEESYFHTIVYNNLDKFKVYNRYDNEQDEPLHNRLLNLTYFEYPKQVTIFKNHNELENLKLKDDFLFIRKLTSEDSVELMDYLDKKNKFL